MIPVDAQLLDRRVALLPDDGFSALRRGALARFAKSGFPGTAMEDWKYTNLRAAAAIVNDWLARPVSEIGEAFEIPAQAADIMRRIDAAWLVVRNGRLHGDLAPISAETGLTIERLDGNEPQLGEFERPLAAFNAALLADGIKVSVPAGRKARKPLGICLIDHPAGPVTQGRMLLRAGEHSEASVVEVQCSAAPGRQLSNTVLQAGLAAGATLDYLRLQVRGAEHAGIAWHDFQLSAGANLAHHGFDLGGSLTRNDLGVELDGRDASVRLAGLYLGAGQQHIDNHTSIRHAIGPTTSREEYRGILGDRARGVFNGKVIVAAGADGTDSGQSNHNLLLSDHAEVDSKPELEIYADDVKCAHGATVGQLDDDALFYLRSRGLAAEQARHMLISAFATALLAELREPDCRDMIASLLERRIDEIVEERS